MSNNPFEDTNTNTTSSLIEAPGSQSLDQLKLQTFLLRLSKVAFACGLSLFIAILTYSILDRHSDRGSIIIGFVLSIVLVGIWLSIKTVYGSDQDSLFDRIVIRIKGDDEIRRSVPSALLVFMALSFWLVGCIVIGSEGHLISHDVSSQHNFGLVDGRRAGLCVVFLLTGTVQLFLMLRPTRRVTIITFICALTSATVSGVLIWLISFHRTPLYFVSGFTRYFLREGKLLEETERDEHGHFAFPYQPWTRSIALMNSMPPLLLTLSLASVMLCLSLLVKIESPDDDGSEENSDEQGGKKSRRFVGIAIGSLLLTCGTLSYGINTFLFTTKQETNWYRAQLEMLMTMPMLPYMLVGLVCLFFSQSKSGVSKLTLFICAIAILVSGSVYLAEKVDDVGLHYEQDAELNQCLSEDGSQLCIKLCIPKMNDKERSCINDCIPVDRRCDGHLDFFKEIPEFEGAGDANVNATTIFYDVEFCDGFMGTYFFSHDDAPRLADEIFCRRAWISLDRIDDMCVCLGLFVALLLAYFNWDAIPGVWTYFVNQFKNVRHENGLDNKDSAVPYARQNI